eukprot:299447_1
MFRLLLLCATALMVSGSNNIIKQFKKGAKNELQSLIKNYKKFENETGPLTTCGGNCPGGCTSCPCGETKVDVSISTWCSKYTWNQANCQCIMKHESGGDENAVNQNTNESFDVGLWQINSMNWASCSGGKAPCNPNTNLECAKDVYKWGGNTWKLWSTCTVCGCCNSP